MLTWNVTYHTKPGQREAFYQACCDIGVRANSQAEAGNVCYDYYFSAADENALLLVETWAEPALQEDHCQTEKFAQLQALKNQYVDHVTIDKFHY